MAETNAKRVYDFVKDRIDRILSIGNPGEQKAVLANLRRGLGHKPGEIPELMDIFLEGLPKDLYEKKQSLCVEETEPTEAEWAIYTALTLFAMHQQRHKIEKELMHQENIGFGEAMAKLVHGENEKEKCKVLKRIRRKFNMAATAADIEEVAWHIKSAVQLLSAEDKGIPLDYAMLARDLYRFQSPDSRESVQLEWGRDFYRQLDKQDKPDSKEDQNNV